MVTRTTQSSPITRHKTILIPQRVPLLLIFFALLFALLLLLLSLTWAPAAHAFVPVDSIPSPRMYMDVEGHPLCIPYLCNRQFEAVHPDVKRAVIMLHAGNRRAVNHFNIMLSTAMDYGNAGEYTLIFTPQFLYWVDFGEWDLEDDVLYWMYFEWYVGNLSGNIDQLPRPAQISSFAIVDTIMHRIVDTCPNLEVLILTGNSAGGKMTSLYSAGGRALDDMPSFQRPELFYMSVNNGHFMYLNDQRPVPGNPGQFAYPEQQYIDLCPTWNDYPFGMNELNGYMAAQGRARLYRNLLRRETHYMIGELEDNPVDTFCEALFQGEHRLERHLIYEAYLDYLYGDPAENVTLHVIDGVGHAANVIYHKPLLQEYLFSYLGSDPTHPPDGTVPANVTPEPSSRNACEVQIGPNPVRVGEMLTVRVTGTSATEIRLYDILGRQVASGTVAVSAASPGTIAFHTNHLASGVYVVRVMGDRVNQWRKVVLLH
ncbi:T9SS type A sorting domain-containing protein [bacterium]|nr:T9SS type A sorting domain-containing protein [bacterium]